MRTYKGHDIFPAEFNTSGLRWYCRTDSYILRSDTLEGMRKLINERVKK